MGHVRPGAWRARRRSGVGGEETEQTAQSTVRWSCAIGSARRGRRRARQSWVHLDFVAAEGRHTASCGRRHGRWDAPGRTSRQVRVKRGQAIVPRFTEATSATSDGATAWRVRPRRCLPRPSGARRDQDQVEDRGLRRETKFLESS